MPKVNTCKACGADNDIIFDNCVFCKKPLERVDYNGLSNEELISNAAEWIQKTREDSIRIPRQDGRSAFYESLNPIILSNGEIRGFAGKYLSMLAYRASQNTELADIYNQLNKEFAKKRISTKKMIVFLGMGALFLGLFFMSNIGTTEEKTEAKDRMTEKTRIEQVNKEIEILIDNKDYEKALIKAEEIMWSYKPGTDSVAVEQYNQQRESIKSTINQLLEAERERK